MTSGQDTAEFADMIAVIILGGVFILFQVIYVGLVSGFVSIFTSLRQGNIFTSVCQEFYPRGGSASVHAGIHPLAGNSPEEEAKFLNTLTF